MLFAFLCWIYFLQYYADFYILQYCAKRLAGKNVSEMTYFVSSGT